jgi:glycosyltransferase involved in cell wall biosynthesis
MRILFVSFWFPFPPDNGSRIRVFNIIKGLSKRHEVFLVSQFQSDSNPDDPGELAQYCKIVSLHGSRFFKPWTLRSLLGYASKTPRSYLDTFDPAVKSAVTEAVRQIKPDALVVSTLTGSVHIDEHIGIPTVLIDHNCEYAVLKRAADKMPNGFKKLRRDLGWKKAASWEANVCRRFDRVVMVSESDKALLLEAAPDLTNVRVVSNGVDTDRFDPSAWRPEPNTLLHNGAMTYSANLDAVRYYADEVYPILKRDCPEAKLKVTGRTDGVDLRGLEQHDGIEFTGYVRDMRDALYASSACIVPLRQGGGMRLKIPEAMAAGVPVISTSMGAEGLECTHGKDILIADSAEEFAHAIKRILTAPEFAKEIARQARQLVEQRYSWSALGDQFADVVEEAISGEHGNRSVELSRIP